MSELAKKIGRPLKRPPRDAVDRINALAKIGHTKEGIAYELGTSPKVLNRWLAEDSRLDESFNSGREVIRQALTSKLLRKALHGEGNVVAMIFALKAMFGWREGESQNSGNQVNVVFNMPDAMPMKDFMEMQIGTTGDGHQPLSINRPVASQRS